MRSAAIILMGLLMSGLSWAGERTVTVCFAPNPDFNYRMQSLAQGYTNRVYRAIGVRLQWKHSCNESERNAPGTRVAPNLATISVEWVLRAPASVSPSAYAAAHPFQYTGTRISLYADRLTPALEEPGHAAAILGHVLAHEIGHVILGHNGHAETGLLKANWSAAEQLGMLYRPLQFTIVQAQTIREALDRRSTEIALR